MIMLNKLYKKLKDVTYADIVIINFVTIIVGGIMSLLWYINVAVEISSTTIEIGLAFWLIVWLLSSGVNSAVLKIIKKKK